MEKQLEKFFNKSKDFRSIDNSLYKKHSVKNGLRNEDGTGVLIGLTKISDVVGYERINDKKVDTNGKLFYRGIDIKELILASDKHSLLYEETCFLILFGYLPTKEELNDFISVFHSKYHLPEQFLESEILRFPTKNLMNKLQKDVLTLYSYDKTPEDTSIQHILDQGLHIVAKMPSLVCYNYASKIHYFDDKSLFVHHIDEHHSVAENILSMIRPTREYSQKEARILDIALVLHADHGGGNNSTFVNVVMSSTGTDIYSSFAGAIGSLKGPKHGGANLKVCEMMDEVIKEIGISQDTNKIKLIIERILDKDFYDNSGLIYGLGHAVYTLSDPRSEILLEAAKELAKEKDFEEELLFYIEFEKIAKQIMFERKGIHCSSNVDFYSGLVYQMLGISRELYTLLFACARSIGWLAHNIESQLYSGKIVRPASKYVGEIIEYVAIEQRGKNT